MAMRSGRIGQFMKRVWVQEVAEKPGQTFLVLAGSILFVSYKQAEELSNIVKQFRKERAEFEMLGELVSQRSKAYTAKQDAFIMKTILDVLEARK